MNCVSEDGLVIIIVGLVMLSFTLTALTGMLAWLDVVVVVGEGMVVAAFSPAAGQFSLCARLCSSNARRGS